MIIKKPYAFLIKHFRLIHLILSGLILFLLTKSHVIFKFFNDYVKNGYYAYSNNITSKYITLYMFIAVIFVILLGSFVYLLMKWKKKNRMLYIAICVFYFAVFIGYLFYFNIFNTILNTNLDVRTVRAYRDIIALLYVPQYIFFILSIIRAIGFDIKKFEFQKDLEELDIAEEDQEEIEVTFGQNNYKYKRSFRKALREIKYYAIENKFFFVIICGVIVLVLAFIIYSNASVFNKKYDESEFFNVDGIVVKVIDSYISDVDLSGKIILKDKKYVIVKVSMENTNLERFKFDTDQLRLMIKDEYYFPVYNTSNYFVDLGEGYYKNTLNPGETYEYLIVYEIPYKLDFKKATFRLVSDVGIVKGEISAKYKDVTLNLENYLDKQEDSNYELGTAISLEDSSLKNSELLVESYTLGESFTETYEYCLSKCYTGKKIIKADSFGKNSRIIMRLNMDLDLDESLYINRYITNNSNFISIFGSLSYVFNGEEKREVVHVKQVDNINTKYVYLEVPEELNRAIRAQLNLTIRNKTYIINLK